MLMGQRNWQSKAGSRSCREKKAEHIAVTVACGLRLSFGDELARSGAWTFKMPIVLEAYALYFSRSNRGSVTAFMDG
eukprot:6202407-Pleurochrysis_carterae.AAC.2